MAGEDQEQSPLRPAGYAALIERYALGVVPNWHTSLVSTGTIHRIDSTGGAIEEVYPSRYWPGESLGDHLEFALKYDGTNLAILAGLFGVVPRDELEAYLSSKPTGKYARRLWFLYEFLTGTALSLDDLKQGNYVDLLDPGQYYTVTPPRRVRRQRINDNLLGDAGFCPTVRRTDELRGFQGVNLTEVCKQVVSAYSPELLKRALSYLYTSVVRIHRHDGAGRGAIPVHRAHNRNGARRGIVVPRQLRRDQESDPEDRRHARPADRSVHPILPPEQRKIVRPKARQSVRFLVG